MGNWFLSDDYGLYEVRSTFLWRQLASGTARWRLSTQKGLSLVFSCEVNQLQSWHQLLSLCASYVAKLEAVLYLWGLQFEEHQQCFVWSVCYHFHYPNMHKSLCWSFCRRARLVSPVVEWKLRPMWVPDFGCNCDFETVEVLLTNHSVHCWSLIESGCYFFH